MLKYLKWGVAIFLVLAIGAAGYFYQNGAIPRILYENAGERLAKLSPLPGLGTGDIAVTNVHLIDMTSEQVQDNYTVIVQNGLISELGPTGQTTVPPLATVIDGSNAYLMPGLADMHVHTDGIPLAYSLFLANGVTTIRELDGRTKYLKWSKAVQDGKILAPTIYTTGPIIRGKMTAAEARAEVIREYKAGYRMVKLYDSLAHPAFHAIMAEAKARNMYTIGHVPYSVGVRGVTKADMDEIAHIHSFHQDFFKDFDPDNVFKEYPIEENKIPEMVGMVKAAGTRVCTTLIVNQALLDSQDTNGYLKQPEMAYAMPWAKTYMRSKAWYFNKMWPGPYLQKVYLPWIYHLTKALQDAGVMLVLGTDSGVTGLIHGFSTQKELGLLVRAGLSPYEALLTGTRNAAAAAGDSDKWGTIEPGKRADMILLSGNPLTDIHNSRKILGVIKAGRWLDRAKLDQMLASVRKAY